MPNIVNIGPKGSKLDYDNWGKPITDAVNNLWLLANPPIFRVYQTVSQNIPTGGWTSMDFQAEEFDTDNGHDNTTNPSRFTVVTPGLWSFSGKVAWDSNTTDRRQTRWRKNGSTVVIGSENSVAPASTLTIQQAATVEVRMAVGDYIELQAGHGSGTTRTTFVSNTDATSHMAGRLVAI